MNVGIGLVVLLHAWQVLASNICPETCHLDWVYDFLQLFQDDVWS
jgi:hypothetical protein